MTGSREKATKHFEVNERRIAMISTEEMITNEDKATQRKDLDLYMTVHPEGITTFEAFTKLRITCLPKRISEMIDLGYPITKTPEYKRDSNGKVIKRYIRYRKAA